MKEDHQEAIGKKDAALALLDDDLQNQNNRIQALQYKKVGLQGEIKAKDQQKALLQKSYVGYFSNEDKSNGISIIGKNNEEAEYQSISTCGQH